MSDEHTRSDVPDPVDNFWDSEEAPNAAPREGVNDAMRFDDANGNPDFVDVQASEAAPVKKGRLVPALIILVGVVALVSAGSAGWSAYQRINPKSNRSVATGTPVIDTTAVAPAADAPVPPAAPGAAAEAGISATAAAAAPGAAVTAFPAPGGLATTSTLAELSPVTAAATEKAAAEKAATEKAAAEVAAAAIVAAAAAEKPVVQATAVTKSEATGKAKPARRPTARSVAGQQADSKGRKTASTQRRSGSRHAQSRRASDQGKAPDGTRDGVAGTLVRYRVMSIYPRVGEFQQAWIRETDSGRIFIVSAGDKIDGMQVKRVDASAYVVTTTQGEIH